MLKGGPSLSEGGSLLLKLSARLLARILLRWSRSSVEAREAALSARLIFSSSTSLAFYSAWLCQDRAPSRVAQSC
jgi:hypothetical protein